MAAVNQVKGTEIRTGLQLELAVNIKEVLLANKDDLVETPNEFY